MGAKATAAGAAQTVQAVQPAPLQPIAQWADSPQPGAAAQPPARWRIAVLVRRFDPRGGGAERYAIALAEQMAAQHEVHVFAQNLGCAPAGVQLHRVPGAVERPRWINQLGFALISWWHTRRGFDIVHSHELSWHGQVQSVHVLPVRYSLWAGRSAWGRLRRSLQVLISPRLWTYLGLEAARMAPQPGRSVLLSAQALVAQVQYSYPRAVLDVLPPGVDAVQPASAARRAQARAALGWRAEAHWLLFVANDWTRKGLATALAGLAQLDADVHLAVVGGGPAAAHWTQQVQALGLQERVHFMGTMSPIDPAFEAADALVHPTREDTYAMVVLEALAHALPVVVSPAPWCGLAAELSHGVHAWVLPHPEDAAALAQGVRHLRSDPALHQRLVQAGLDLATQNLWSARARGLQAVYARALAASSSPKR